MHHLLKEFQHVTEQAAIATFPWVGKGDKNRADEAATTSMRNNLNELEMQGVIVIGEGEIDDAPMLSIDEKVGRGTGIELDTAVDPIDGTTPTAAGTDHGITVIAAAPKGTLLHAPDMYMERMIVGAEAKGTIDMEAPLMDNLQAVAKAKQKRLDELHVVIQNRPRHLDAIHIMKAAGVTVHLFQDGDVLQALKPCIQPEKIDMLYNIGGAPEGVLSSVAVNCLGGEMQARLSIRNDDEYVRCMNMSINNPKQVLRHDDLMQSEEGFFLATAITNTVFLKGIQKESDMFQTETLLIDNKKHAQIIQTTHERQLVYA